MTVYVVFVTLGGYGDPEYDRVAGIFETEALARAWIARTAERKGWDVWEYRVEAWTVGQRPDDDPEGVDLS